MWLRVAVFCVCLILFELLAQCSAKGELAAHERALSHLGHCSELREQVGAAVADGQQRRAGNIWRHLKVVRQDFERRAEEALRYSGKNHAQEDDPQQQQHVAHHRPAQNRCK